MEASLPRCGTYFLIDRMIWRIAGLSGGKSPHRIYAVPVAAVTVPPGLFAPMVEGPKMDRKMDIHYFRACDLQIANWIPIPVNTDEEARARANALQSAVKDAMPALQEAERQMRAVQASFAAAVTAICTAPPAGVEGNHISM